MSEWNSQRKEDVATAIEAFCQTSAARAIAQRSRYRLSSDTAHDLYIRLANDPKGASLISESEAGQPLQRLVNHQAKFHLLNLVSRHHWRWVILAQGVPDLLGSGKRWNGKQYRCMGRIEAGLPDISALKGKLCPQSRAIVDLLAKGFSVDDIASTIGVSPRTVSRRIREIRVIARSN